MLRNSNCWFKPIYFKSNIHGNYNIVIYINIIGSEQKHKSLFGSSPKQYLLSVEQITINGRNILGPFYIYIYIN